MTIELQDWANWVAQDENGPIWQYESEPVKYAAHFTVTRSNADIIFDGAVNHNWPDSKINLNTNSAYIDAEGILRKCELIPEMLKPQAD